jgi:hypothetical protein
VIADTLEIPDGPDASHHALPIKNTDSMMVALPDCYSFAIPMAKLVTNDLLTLYGKEKFRSLKLSFILQRSDFESGTVHRANFPNWHTHNNGRAPIDLTYQFTNTLGTEFILAGTNGEPFILNAPINALTRFGGEIPHRSPQNNTNITMRRSWGAFLIYDRDYPSNYVTCNSILDAKNIERALEKFALQNTPSPKIFDTPIALTKYSNKFIIPAIPETLKTTFPDGLRFGFHSAATGVYKAVVSDLCDKVSIQTEAFRQQPQEEVCPRDYWEIQHAMMKLGAHP